MGLSLVKISAMSISFFLVMGGIVHAESEQAGPASPPPVSQELVREGDLAIKLQSALGLGTTEDEAEAETRLGEAGITPRNGWIADYPVTPDIIGELRNSVRQSADAKKIALNKDEALKKMDDVAAGLDLPVKPYTGERTSQALPENVKNYPDQTVINNYYYDEGPPVVTYYAPPPDYYYLYAWVPSPFWWFGFWFPGFFILNDFHRPFFFHNRFGFVSNHFNDVRVHRVFRIDPVSRFSGRTFAGIGVANRRGFISTGVPRSERRIFNSPRTRGGPSVRTSPSPRGGRSFSAPSRMSAPPSGGGGVPAPRGGGMTAPRGGGGGGMTAPRGGGGGGGFSGGGRVR